LLQKKDPFSGSWCARKTGELLNYSPLAVAVSVLTLSANKLASRGFLKASFTNGPRVFCAPSGKRATMIAPENWALLTRLRQTDSASCMPISKSTTTQSGPRVSRQMPTSKMLRAAANLKPLAMVIQAVRASSRPSSLLTTNTLASTLSSNSPKGIPFSRRNWIRYSLGTRRSWLPGIRYPFSRPESNHLETVLGATLQILAIWPVVKTFISHLLFVFAFFASLTIYTTTSFRNNIIFL